MTPIEKAALDLYTPPFTFDEMGGKIWDAKGNMAADNGDIETYMARVRGWGRIQYLKDFEPEELQDAVGEHMAKAMTEYWEKHQTK